MDTAILRTGRHIPSRGFLGKDGDGSSMAAAAVWVTDVQGTPDDNTVQRLPELSATLLPREIGGTRVEAAGEIFGTYFYREGGDRDLRGRSYGEISRTFSFYPSVTAAPFLFLDLLGSTTTSGKNGDDEGGRVVPGGGMRAAADIRREFAGGTRPAYLHSLTPNVTFRWVPSVDQGRIPLTDEWARVGPQTQFTFSLDQRVIRLGGGTGPFELASLSLEWAYDVSGKRAAGGSPYLDPLSPYVRVLRDQIDLAAGRIGRERLASSDLFARFKIRPMERWSFNGETLFGFTDRAFTTVAVGADWKKNKDNHLLLEYRSSRDLSEDIHAVLAYRPVPLVGVGNETNYSLKNRELTDGSVTLTIYPRSDCWSVGVAGGRRSKPDEKYYKLFFTLKGIGTLGN